MTDMGRVAAASNFPNECPLSSIHRCKEAVPLSTQNLKQTVCFR